MKPTPNHPLRDGLLVTAAVMGVITFCILLLYFQARAAFERDQQHDLLNYAQAAALLVDGDLHQTLTAAEQEATPAYRLAVAPLERFLRAMPELHFVYTMIRQADGVHIVLDATPPGDANGDGVNDHAALLELYEPSTLSPALLAALTGGTARADCVAYTDKWGTFLSGFAPIRNSAGQLVGIVGVDITADLYLGRLQHFRHALFTALVAAASASLLFGGLVARLRQRQARAEIENREHSAFLQSILDNLPTPVFVKDTAGIYRACNRAFQEYVGLPRDRIVGRGVFDVAPPELAEKYKAMDDALFARPGSQTYDGSVRYADDTRHDVHFIKHTFTDTQGRVAGIVGAMLDITEVRRSEQRYRDLYEQMINGYALHEIICDAQGVPCDYRFLQVNTAFEKLTGLKREDIIGRTVKEVLPGTEDSWIKTYGQVALNGAPVFFESYSAALGHWYEIHAFSPERGKFAAIFSDTTERKRAEHALRESEAMLRAITDNMSDLVCKVDLAMRFEYCSPSFTRILGYPVNELIGCNAVEFMHPDDRQIMQETHPILLATGRSPTATFRLRHQDGRYLWVEAVGTLIRDERGQPAGKVISGRDITQRREAEEKLRQAMRDLERFNQLMLGREERVLELKWMVNELLARLGEPPRFDVTQPPAADGGSP